MSLCIHQNEASLSWTKSHAICELVTDTKVVECSIDQPWIM